MARRSLLTAVCLVAMATGAFAEDRLELKTVSQSLIGRPTNNSPDVISGARFKELQPDIKAVIILLENKTNWSNFGPDASYVSMKIFIGDKRYTLNSWYPLFRTNQNVAVSETGGLAVVPNAVEKKTIEDANSAKYKQIVGLFDRAEAALHSKDDPKAVVPH